MIPKRPSILPKRYKRLLEEDSDGGGGGGSGGRGGGPKRGRGDDGSDTDCVIVEVTKRGNGGV